MSRISIALAILALAILACAVPVGNPLPTQAAPTATALAINTELPTQLPTVSPAEWTAEVRLPTVNVRKTAGGDPSGKYVTFGDTVTILACVGDWCKIEQPFGYVYRGCLSDNPRKLGCITE